MLNTLEAIIRNLHKSRPLYRKEKGNQYLAIISVMWSILTNSDSLYGKNELYDIRTVPTCCEK